MLALAVIIEVSGGIQIDVPTRWKTWPVSDVKRENGKAAWMRGR